MENTELSQKSSFLLRIHELNDWMSTWGDPRSTLEEKQFFDTKAQIMAGETSLKPLLQTLRLHLEKFIDEFNKQTHTDTEVGKTFIEKGHAILSALPDVKEQFDKEQAPLLEQLEKMLSTMVRRVEAQVNT